MRRGVQRLAAEPRQLAGSGLDENELRTLLLRLREDDVEYFDLKVRAAAVSEASCLANKRRSCHGRMHRQQAAELDDGFFARHRPNFPPLPACLPPQAMCKERQLGGRDSKDNLRAKLLRRVRQDLGMPVFGPDNVQPADVRPPQSMNSEELRQLFDSRDCMMPASRSQILAMANALLIADGLLTPEQAVWPQSSDGSWASLSAVKLRQACVVRGLPSKGLRNELVKRLEAHDAAAAAAAAAPDDPPAADAPAADPTPAAEAPVEVPAEAVAEEVSSGAGSSSDEEGRELGAVPAPSNTSQLQAAQDMWAGLKRMDVSACSRRCVRVCAVHVWCTALLRCVCDARVPVNTSAVAELLMLSKMDAGMLPADVPHAPPPSCVVSCSICLPAGGWAAGGAAAARPEEPGHQAGADGQAH